MLSIQLKISLYLAAFVNVVVFVITPLLLDLLGLQNLVYLNQIKITTLLFNFLIISPIVLIGLLIKSRPRKNLHNFYFNNFPRIIIFFLILLWSIIYIYAGGLDLRMDDVRYGIESRGLITKFFIFNNCIIIICVSLFAQRKKLISSILIASIPSLLFIIGGHRLIFLELFVSCLFVHFIKNKTFDDFFITLPKFKIKKINLSFKNKFIKNLLISIFLIILGLFLFSVWGYRRQLNNPNMDMDAYLYDGAFNFYFSFVWRLSEPFWHWCFSRYEQFGTDWDIFNLSISRMISILGRWIGINYPWTIDGSEYLFEEKLNFPPLEGVHLPITLIGEGYLFNGYIGAFLYNMIGLMFYLSSFKLLSNLPIKFKDIYIAFIFFHSLKVITLYPKTLSGAFLYLFYSPLRDFLFLYLLIYFYDKILKK